MLVATITEAKNKLSALIDHVRGGESVLIVDRGIPVARLESAVGAEGDPDGRLARLERAGLIRLGEGAVSEDFLSTPPVNLGDGVSALEALLAERREGR